MGNNYIDLPSDVSLSIAEAANTVLAGPTSGGAALPTFRALLPSDLPIGPGLGSVTSVDIASTGPIFTAGGPIVGAGTLSVSFTPPGSSGNVLMSNGLTWLSTPIVGTAGGTVTSVSLATSSPSIFNIAGSPVTNAGVITLQETIQSTGKVWAGPSSGSLSVAPVFRALLPTDIPAALLASCGVNGGVSGILPVYNGGSSSGAFDLNAVLLGNNQSSFQKVLPGSSGNVLISDGTTWHSSTVPNAPAVTSVALASSSPSLFNVTGSPVVSTGTLTLQATVQSSSLFLAGPISGDPASPLFRSIQNSEVPATNLAITGNGGVTGILPIARGGSSTGSFDLNTVLLGNNTSPLQKVFPGSSGNVLISDGTIWKSSNPPAVTSVNLATSGGTIETFSGGPITTAGVITSTLNLQSSAMVFSGPASGESAIPAFRSLIADDIPIIPMTKLGSTGQLTVNMSSGIVPPSSAGVSNGGISIGSYETIIPSTGIGASSSTSGTIHCTMTFTGSGLKMVTIQAKDNAYIRAGTSATYKFPVPFTYIPQPYGNATLISTVKLSTTGIIFAGYAKYNGFFFLHGL